MAARARAVCHRALPHGGVGGHLDRCCQCGHEVTSFNSCRSRHCPKCQTNARNKWLAERSKELLPVQYVHVVFTIPHELSWLALQNKKIVCDLLFRATALPSGESTEPCVSRQVHRWLEGRFPGWLTLGIEQHGIRITYADCIEHASGRAGESMQFNQAPTTSRRDIDDARIALDRYVILAVISPMGKIRDVNEKFCELSKFSREELLIQDYQIMDSTHQPKELLENLWATIAAGQVWTGEIKNRTKEDSYYWVAATIIPFLDEHRRPVQCLAILADITQRKEQETTLSRLAAIIDSSDDAIVAKDLKGMILSWNSAAERIFGYTGEEIIGASMMQLVPPDKQEEENQILWKIQCGESLKHVETMRRTKAGRLISVSLTAFPIKNAEGRVVGVSSLVRDISDRQIAQFDVRRERDRARQYLDIAEVILLELDRDGKIVLVNRYACSVLGWEASELIGRDWIETCLPTRIQQPLREKFAKLIGGDLSVVENLVLTKSGEERLIEWRN